MKDLFLGFDTSNYTTSAALCDGEGSVICNFKCPLPVGEGERGLRQSEAVFAHVKNAPEIARRLGETLPRLRDEGYVLRAGAVSAAPRSVEGSYMPCFLVGRAIAENVCAVLGVPLYESSHQNGHIMAAAASACRNAKLPLDSIISKEHIALHVSGGTTELLYVRPDSEKIFAVEHIGGSADANAGQIIDRIGVRMGYRFPCGAMLDSTALEYEKRISVGKLPVNELTFNLSGLENKASAMLERGERAAYVSAYVLTYIARSLETIVKNAYERCGRLPTVFAGGVMSSRYIRRLIGDMGYFADAEFSSDNAAGIALIAARLYSDA